MTHPSPEQCSQNARLPDIDGKAAFAIWVPQIGGYGAHGIVMFHPSTPDNPGCFDLAVWHDGEFPIQPDDPSPDPYELHFCSAEQIVEFGQKVLGFQQASSLETDRDEVSGTSSSGSPRGNLSTPSIHRNAAGGRVE